MLMWDNDHDLSVCSFASKVSIEILVTEYSPNSLLSEFLLGENILVAPVFTANTTSRSIYLPAGIWFDQGDTNKTYEGPTWITYSAPLDVLPYFVKDVNVPSMASTPYVAVILVLLGALVNIFVMF